jgi:hypothetical protein
MNEEKTLKALEVLDELIKEMDHFFDDIFEKKRDQDAD